MLFDSGFAELAFVDGAAMKEAGALYFFYGDVVDIVHC